MICKKKIAERMHAVAGNEDNFANLQIVNAEAISPKITEKHSHIAHPIPLLGGEKTEDPIINRAWEQE